MKREGEQCLLRIIIRSTDRAGWSQTSEALLKAAFRLKLAGATILEGVSGVDVAGRLLQPRWWSLIRRVPTIVEVTDRAEAVGAFLAVVESTVRAGIATLERVHVLIYRHAADAARNAAAMPSASSNRTYLPSFEEFPIMRRAEDGQLLRIFVDHSDLWNQEPLHRAILQKAREVGVASAMVFRADSGFGAHHRLHSSRGEYVSDQPMLIEIVDATAKIESLLPHLDEMIGEGLVTIEGVRLLRFGQNPS